MPRQSLVRRPVALDDCLTPEVTQNVPSRFRLYNLFYCLRQQSVGLEISHVRSEAVTVSLSRALSSSSAL